MAFTFSLWEIFEILITVAVVGFIFSPKRPNPLELEMLGIDRKKQFLKDLKFGIAIAAPAVVFHELAHKFVARAYGFSAVYQASWFGLGLGMILKILSPGFIFFLPGYVSISGVMTHPMQFGLVALAGPLANLALFGLFTLFLKKDVAPQYQLIWHIGRQINLWLMIFNMLPIPGLDGFKVYSAIWQTLF